MLQRILLVEDDPNITRSLSELLTRHGFSIEVARGRGEALSALEAAAYDLLLLDISLPDGNGYSVCAAAKREYNDTPVIFLTADDDEYSVVTGLDMGADDYITKPFRPMELVSRIRTVLRRGGRGPDSGRAQPVYELGDVRVDTLRGKVTKRGAEVLLSALEYRLLAAMLADWPRGAIMTRAQLLNTIWDASGAYGGRPSSGGDFVNDNTLTVYIKRLREKLEDDPAKPTLICTVRGLGYRLEGGGDGE